MSERIFVAHLEDEESIRGFLELVAVDEGHGYWGTAAWQQAVRYVKENPVDLVFLDLGLPGKTGDQVAGNIREVKPQVKMVVLTAGYPNKDQQSRLEQAGINEIYQKPVDVDVLVGVMSRVAALKRNIPVP